ncbi:MAG: hypothetical protein E5V92_12630 [Mesorhizobium sp.]|uniref:hypothetical protein n=1 Tax=unclassified Mesorhizobium TaxID=325217 RepID=UPI000F7656BC|nr:MULTISPECIES: hypothetical protein [unclassified Mesorhizobium]AZO71237.1 hypothetical protein EJ067_08550 [Mesorhizobium sp. M1D.F.Ca.ET.043.01.1.1]RWD66714.1 MAG: hypothetical protein EOS36_04460 [Mesorhizobium sp.]RWE05231.1 MAG: hypothetical protein EOS61_23330 [Mesorhizobium sp.]RWE38801.1 MAG: hypothetical protein EOS79_22250 [Mesorhizobium sp.]TIV73163.1 MAG: hypothetical protein E5V89_01800 [Mesorhizobium sp.]
MKINENRYALKVATRTLSTSSALVPLIGPAIRVTMNKLNRAKTCSGETGAWNEPQAIDRRSSPLIA